MGKCPMKLQSIDDIQAKLPELLEQVPYLRLLVLFGSRARGDHQESSDWDFAMLFDEDLRKQYEPSGGWDCYRSWMILQNLLDLGDDEIDWVDMKHASVLLAHAIARDGVVVYAHDAEVFQNFRYQHLKSPAELKQMNRETRELIHQKLAEWKAIKV
jgi:uncharacterized protein